MLTTADRLAILDLLAVYNQRTDAGGEGWPDCFTADGRFEAGPQPHILLEGREALEAYARERMATRTTQVRHWTNNSVIEGDGDGATHSCYLMVTAVDEVPVPSVLGKYRDHLVREDGRWKFRERRLELAATTASERMRELREERAAIG